MLSILSKLAPSVARRLEDVQAMRNLPQMTICLMLDKTEGNDPFYRTVVERFHRNAVSVHPRYKVIPGFKYGVACCDLAAEPRGYQWIIESSARRNYKKAARTGYTFRRIDFNAHLADIGRIRRSTDVRQGKVPTSFFEEVSRISDPPSRSSFHDYPYFGVFFGDQLRAYGSCLVSGELMSVEHILGHADHVEDGIVPMLLIEIAEYARQNYPSVRYYCYGSFFGASPTMRRFKTKFGFSPHKVTWTL